MFFIYLFIQTVSLPNGFLHNPRQMEIPLDSASLQTNPRPRTVLDPTEQGDPSFPAIPPDLLSMLWHQQAEVPQSVDGSIRGSWSQHEDDLLTQAVARIGASKWIDIARFIPTRTPKQCRERWHNRLAPTLRREPFEAWEDQIIIDKQKMLGNRWTLIAQSLVGRSPGAIKNRWYAGLKGGRGMTTDTVDSLAQHEL
jgi:hypothetical protein